MLSSEIKKTVFFTNQEKFQIHLPTQKNCRFYQHRRIVGILPTQKNCRFFYQPRKIAGFLPTQENSAPILTALTTK